MFKTHVNYIQEIVTLYWSTYAYMCRAALIRQEWCTSWSSFCTALLVKLRVCMCSRVCVCNSVQLHTCTRQLARLDQAHAHGNQQTEIDINGRCASRYNLASVILPQKHCTVWLEMCLAMQTEVHAALSRLLWSYCHLSIKSLATFSCMQLCLDQGHRC